MKILVIDDEEKTARYLQKGLKESGFVVDVAFNGDDGLHAAVTNSYDLIILDVMMPERNGWSVIEEIRKQGTTSLTMFLTARDKLTDRVQGLNLGADAYLVKPFAFQELLAHVRSLLRRSQARFVSQIKALDFEIDLLQHSVTRAGKRVDLTPKEFSLMSLLARRADEVLSRSFIAAQVWDMNFDSDTNVVDVHIRRLRSKIDDHYEKKLIHTVRGLGYVFRVGE